MGAESAALDRAGVEADARHERMDRVAVLFGEITAATREFLRALAESDRHRDWAAEGFRSCAEWLSWRIGITRDTAGEKVRAARALEGLPLISRAMQEGRISFSKVRALTRAATPENEAELLAFAKASSAASLERLVRGYKTMDRADEQRAEQLRHRMRCFSVFPNNEGMYVVKGLLTPEIAALLMRAIDGAGDALFAAIAKDDCGLPDPDQRRADALGLVAERALAAGFGASDAPVSGSRAERYQVMVHVEPKSLCEQGEPGMSELEDGTRLSAESSRRLCCDASCVELTTGKDGSVLDVGRRTRTVPPAIRRALEARDRGCRFPGCGLRFTDAHHVVHWADGGDTSLRTLLLLCAHHHRAVHEGGFRVCLDTEAKAVFFSPHGTVVASAPPMPEIGPDPLQTLLDGNRARGLRPDWRSGMPDCKHEHDVPWEVEAAARDALERGETPTVEHMLPIDAA